MAVTINAKGTSVPYFKIGKQGTTFYQGDADPSNTYTINTNDIWFDTSNGTVKFRVSNAWSGITTASDLTVTGDILPSADVTYDLGSPSKMWKDIYVGPGSLYVNGKKVIEDDSGAIHITTDVNEDLKLSTTGTGTLKLISGNSISVTGEINATSGDLQIGDHIDMNSNLIKEVATPVSNTDAANKAYADSAASSAVTSGSNAVSGTTGTFSGEVTVAGNLTVSGTTTTINTSQINLADNILLLNSDATGSPTTNAGIEIERGDSLNVQLLWDETNDRWSIDSKNLYSSGTFIGDLTGNVTGNVTGDVTGNTAGTHTGNVIGNLIGDVIGDVTGSAGTVTSIAGHLLDEDNMVSDSATEVPSQQSVKAYVASQIATKDNTDEITEGSNLYYTDTRARQSISATGSLSYNNSTGVISYTQGNTDTITEGSTNLYYTDARAEAVSINNLVEDTTPQLGGDLDLNGNSIASASNGDIDLQPNGTGNVKITSTGAFIMPVGTTSQRPETAVIGMMRFNSDVDMFEGYNGVSWVKIGWSFASDYGLITETSEVFTTNYGAITDTDTTSYTTDRGLITEDVIY